MSRRAVTPSRLMPLLAASAILTFLLCYACTFLVSNSNSPSAPAPSREPLLVLLWTDYFSKTSWLPSTVDLGCPVTECFITYNKSRFSESAAVLVHWRDAVPINLPPKCMGDHCPLLVLYNMEAPPHTSVDTIRPLKDRVHWVITYRRDSNVLAPYGQIVRRKNSFTMPELKSNRELVCWLVSNCKTSSLREDYVHKLMKYIPVDVYGRCGNKTCPYISAKDCYRWMSNRCKFYLSFENSLCEDYITEKLYYALGTDMVPVVRGGANYSSFLPRNSYIDVADFSSPEVLAKFLTMVGNNAELYRSYFRWKYKYTYQDASYIWFCDLCKKLHYSSRNAIVPIQDVISWWFDKSKCVSCADAHCDI